MSIEKTGGEWKTLYIEGKNILGYLVFLFLSIVFTLTTVFWPRGNREIKKVKERKSHSAFGLEFGKISGQNTFSKLLISILTIFVIVFISFMLEDIKFASTYEDTITEIADTNLYGIKENAASDLEYFKEDFGEDSDDYKDALKMAEGDIAIAEDLYEDSKKAYSYYKEKIGKKYYAFKYNETVQYRSNFSSYIKGKFYTEPSYEETKALYKEMSKENILPLMVISDPFMSSLEDVDPWKQEYRKDNVYSHSALYLPRRIERTYPIDLLLISLISLISLGAYSYDKENGNQIEFMYTEPVARRKYHWRKILASFLVGLMTLGLILALLFILALATEGLGDPNFPVVKYIRNISPENVVIEAEPYFDLIPLWKYDLRLIGSYIFQIGFLASLGAFISIFVKEKIKVVGMTLGITAIFIYLGRLIQSPLKVLSPFTHMEAARLSNGSQILGIGLKTNNIYISLGVLLAWTLIFGLLGSLIVKKKEVR